MTPEKKKRERRWMLLIAIVLFLLASLVTVLESDEREITDTETPISRKLRERVVKP